MYDTKAAGTLLDRQKEIDSKEEYQPNAHEQLYNAAIYAEFQIALWQFLNPHQFFNDRTLRQYITRNQQDIVSYVPPARDPLDWRNHRRSTLQYDKTSAILSFFIDLNFQAEPIAQDWLGRVNPKMGEVCEALLEHANILDNQTEKDKLADFALLVDGTVAEEVTWCVKKRVKKTPKKPWKITDDPSSFIYDTRWTDFFEGVETRLVKINRVLLGDVSKPDISEQPYIFKEFVIPYDKAYELFHAYKNWKFVKPFNITTDQWTDTDTDLEIEQAGENIQRLVRVRVYENMLRNEYALYCNRVLMTPVGLNMPQDRYSITWQQAGLLNHHFAYGRSFVGHLRADVATRDVLFSLFIDSSRQGLEPPMKSSFKALLNRHMFRPAAITSSQGGMLEPLIPPNAMQGFAREAIEMLEQNINKASVSPIFQGQGEAGSRTKYEVEQQLINSIRTAALIVSATVNRRKQKAEAMFSEIIKHYPSLSMGELSAKADEIKRFVVSSPEGDSQKEVMFQAAETPKEGMDLAQMLMEAEDKTKRTGMSVKKYLVDPKSFQTFEFVFNFRVNPQQRSSKSADLAEVERKYMTYIQNPLIDPMYATRLLLQANGDDPDDAIKPPEPIKPPQASLRAPESPLGQPGAGQGRLSSPSASEAAMGEPRSPMGIAGTPSRQGEALTI